MNARLYGVGVDILRVERMERLWERHGARLTAKLLAPVEQAECAARGQPGRYVAKAFAAKEAFVKALGTGFRGVAYHDVATVRDALGKPALVIGAALRARLDTMGVGAVHVSLSDDGGLVCAMVVLERA